MKTPSTGAGAPSSTAAAEVEKKNINAELWQACAGPLVNLPAAGTHVVYFPQGHSEQVAASMKKDVDAQIPNYPNLPSKLLCLLHNVTLHADPETDEVYAQMTLQPVPSFDKEALLRSDLTMKTHKPQTEFFCKTLTASDTSTHGGFSVPRRAAEKIFPPLDFTLQPPAQELMARDLHDNVWTFRHIYRGQPKRHLLTTGWSLFVSGKRLFAGDSVLFIRDEKQQLLLGIRRANRQPPNLSSSVLSSDSMHIGILAAAAHAAANNSPFTVFYNPRASPSEFVIPLAKYYKAVCSNQLSLGMRFRMMFETEESGTRRYMGTITGITDLDPVRWKNSQWRNLQVGWDESTAGERRNRVSIWEIEPVTAPFFMCPTPPFFRSKRPRQPGMPDEDSSDLDNLFRRTMPWLGDDFGLKEPQQAMPGLSLVQWMNMQQNPSLANSMQPNYINPLSNPVLQNFTGVDNMNMNMNIPRQLPPQQNNLQQQFNSQRPVQQQLDQLQKQLPIQPPQQQFGEITQSPSRPNLITQTLAANQAQAQAQNQLLNHQQLQRNLSQNHPPQQQQNMMPDQNMHIPDNNSNNQQIQQLQLLQKLHQQQQSLLAQQQQQSAFQQQPQQQLQDHQKQLLDNNNNIPTNLSRSVSTASTQMLENASQITHSNLISQQQHISRTSSQTSLQFSQPKLQHQQSGITINPLTNQLSACGGQSAVTDDIPSCSTSPSTNNCPNTVTIGRNHHENIIASASTLLNSSGLETLSKQKSEVKPSLNISKNPNHGFFNTQTYLNTGTHLEYLDHNSSSSATSVLSQNNDVHIPQVATNNNSNMSFNVIPFGANNNMDNNHHQLDIMPLMPDQLITKDMVGPGKDFPSTSGGGLLSSYENPNKETQPELSSSMVSQSFGVPDMTFDSTINDDTFLNGGAWAPPQIPRMRTYTKVYKRGAVGRSIDIARYSGYDELKQDLARRFGIEGQLEDRQRIGWKLVYVDHENDVLLVGDDPWEEFVSCVHCIKILSPQEVQQMSLDGDFGNNILQNQACSSSDNGVN